jgi:transcriptional regulator with XRE-family HTH domain
MTDSTACKTLQRIRKQKGFSRWKLALNLRLRYSCRLTEDDIAAFEQGSKRPADTLRSRIAKQLDTPEREVFPEYLIECKTLRQTRQQQHLNLRQLAELFNRQTGRNMPYNELCAYERGLRYCHPTTRRQLATTLGTTEDQLFPEYKILQPAREPSGRLRGRV